MARTFSIKGWKKFQHYKHRNPPWIRFYNTTLDDYAVAHLPDASKAHLFGIWLLASKYNNTMPDDAAWIAKKINANSPVDLEILASAGLITWKYDASKPQAPRKQNAVPEQSRVETEKKTDSEREGPQVQDGLALAKQVGDRLAGRGPPNLPANERKAIWQGKICVEAQKTMPNGEYSKWLEAYGNNEPWAKRKAEEIDKVIRARSV